MARQVDEYYCIDRAKRWLEQTGFDVKSGKKFIQSVKGLYGCTIEANGKSVTVTDETVNNAKDIFRGLCLLKR